MRYIHTAGITRIGLYVAIIPASDKLTVMLLAASASV